MEDGSNISDTIVNADNRSFSQDENTESDVPSLSIKKKTQRNLNYNALCSKVLVIFGVCFIIGCYLIPIILYYVDQSRGNPEVDPEFPSEKNASAAKVCCKLIIIK